MRFIQDWLLWALPLALLPIIIHLINQNRHRTVKWAAMMFLLDAKKMTKGIARLRQILILAMRVFAVAALILAAGRPLASGWLALTAGGESDTILVLLDRSASMEQQNLETGISKRITALEKLSDMLSKTARSSRIVLIESANLEVVDIDDPKNLVDIPATASTDTSADIPSLLQAALDYISLDQSGRTDVWLASDLRTADWKPGDGRWESLRAAFSEVDGVSFFLLNYPELSKDKLAVRVENLLRRKTPEGFELVMDLLIQKPDNQTDSQTVPVELTINGARTVEEMTINGDELRLQGHTVNLGKSESTGWGRMDLPADSNLRDNTFFFVFDEAATLKTVILSDDDQTAGAIKTAASAAVDSSRSYLAEILPTSRKTEIPWDETALLFWQDEIPTQDSAEAKLMKQFLEQGKSIVLLPPAEGFSASASQSSSDFLGFKWNTDPNSHQSGDFKINWWRTDSGLLENTQNGNPLPLGSTKIFKINEFEVDGEIESFLKIEDGRTVISKHINNYPGNLYIWATLPRSSHSSLGTDGVAFFVMIHRALRHAGNFLSNAQQRVATGSLPGTEPWNTISQRAEGSDSVNQALIGGAFKSTEKWLAINRPSSEDDLRIVNTEALEDLFSGLEHRVIKDSVNNRSALAAEIWKVFLVLMALALVTEAALCLPPKPTPETSKTAV